ncbi:heme ABC transporter permease [Pollutimonas nitritireducens]|uniref:Heme ABC transporter permease n=1 Tax=Pollutimonas nitritireducens TaxID=2045209 RepID=A0A2N4UF29_9BURK|nr:heme ABC transporter permease [Pollutimonas nitritireducens]PLC53621.1 heme ABC transporter permease [Pollutimonas nitritireducens]
MAPYHVLMVHFPIALWITATLAILLRAFSGGALAHAVDRALVPLLSVSLVFGIIAFALGLLVWPWETISASALGRNHILAASWTITYWAMVLVVRWRRGEAVWNGLSRWIMAGFALVGSALLGITGTLGGHLVGIYTEVSVALRMLGWDVYTTYYVPNMTLAAILVVSVLLLGLGEWARRTFYHHAK